MAGMGMGSANPATPPAGLPLGSSTWAAGGWWDLITVPGAPGAAIAGPQASLAGSNILTPASSPLVNATAVGGQRGGNVVDTGVAGTEPRFSCDALASLFPAGQPWSVYWDFRQSKQAEMPLWAALSSSTTDAMGCRSIGERLCFRYRSAATGIVTVTGTIPLAYDYHRLGATYDGTNLRLYVDGVLDPATPVAVPSLGITLNRFTWLASVSSIAFEGATGFSRRLCMSPSALSAANIATVDAYFVSNDWTLQGSSPLVPKLIAAGASILVGASDAVTGAGYRAGLSNAIITGRLSWLAVGDRPQGIVPLRETPAQSGQSAVQITTQVTSFVDARTGLLVIDLGNQEINAGQTAVQVQAAITTALRNSRAALYAVNPEAFVSVSTLLPYFEAGFNAVAAAVNAALPGIWSASDAEFPAAPKLLRWDGNSAMGGPSYVQANYNGVGDNHPNSTGYALLIPALLAASNADGQVLSNVLAQLSPT